MKHIKTAKGQMLDMGTLAAKHSDERAVSNVPVNAKGDIIDSRGQVKVTREEVKKAYYKDNVPGIEERVSIKEDGSVDTTASDTDETKKENDGVVEVSRKARVREDGSQYFEIEYSDGSIEEVEV